MRHLQPCPLEPALDIESLIRLTAVQDRLVAANLLSDKVQRLNNSQTQLLALLVLGDSNVLDVADQTELVDELALDDEGAGADDLLFAVEDADQKVGVVAGRHPCVALVPCLFVSCVSA